MTFLFSLMMIFSFFKGKENMPVKQAVGNAYYFNVDGNDESDGTKDSPFKTIKKLNSLELQPGDTVCLQSGQTFNGNIFIDSSKAGTSNNPIVITSSGDTNAIINAGSASGLTVNKSAFVKIDHLSFIGSGRKNGNTKDGVAIIGSHDIEVDSLDISGFQKAGLLVYTSKNIDIKNVLAHENGYAGIAVSGDKTKESCSNVHINNCRAVNNPGDPTNLTNHSGNGIVAGYCKNVLIEYSTATNNGWDMPRTGNGPVGIWTFEADSVTIQYCISYKNKTSKGGGDGGGFDLDGGVTNSVIQNCISYENQGSGFGIFQYAGASNWHDNTIRNNISENDGNVSAAGASAFIWNGSRDKKQFKNLRFYNNILYNENGAAISYEKDSENTGFSFYNNIFVGADELIKGKDSTGEGIFLENNWWSLKSRFNIGGIKDFKLWAINTGKEQKDTQIIGFNEDPLFENPGKTSLTSPAEIKTITNYRIPENSHLIKNLPAYELP